MGVGDQKGFPGTGKTRSLDEEGTKVIKQKE